MRLNGVKVTVCAVAAATLVSGMSIPTDAARMSNLLPAAGIGLILEEGSTISQIQASVAKKANSKKSTNGTAQKRSTKTALTELTAAGDSLIDRKIEEEMELTVENLAHKSSVTAGQNTEQESQAETEEAAEAKEDTGAETSSESAAETETADSESTAGQEASETESGAAETETGRETTAETESAEEGAGQPSAASVKGAESGAIVEPVSLKEINEKNAAGAAAPSDQSSDKEAAAEDTADAEAEEASDLIIAQVNDYVNIRQTPDTEGEIVGKLYDNSVGTLIKEENGWYEIQSGNVSGYVKSDYFVTGSQAKKIADEVGDKVAEVTTETLFVRESATTESSVIDMVPMGEELTVLEESDGWVKVSVEGGDGYVSKDFLNVHTVYVTAESAAEEKARLEKEEKAKEEAAKAAEEAARKLTQEREAKAKEEAKKKTQEEAAKAQEEKSEEVIEEEIIEEVIEQDNISVSGSGMGQAVADFAVQFVGNPYVYGGTSLTNGADCSGFVMSVYKNFGVSLPHSSSADRSVGYSVGGLSNAQPGDLVCYSGHVGIYIGNGQIVHASTAKTGIKISNANYRSVLAVRRIFS